jgi:aspartate aminotransferase
LSSRAQAETAIATMVAEFRRRRDAAARLLRDANIDFIDPRGAFYLFLRVPKSGRDGDPGSTFARTLLDERDVAVVPGAAFRAPEWIRISYAAPMDDVLEGVRRTIELMTK